MNNVKEKLQAGVQLEYVPVENMDVTRTEKEILDIIRKPAYARIIIEKKGNEIYRCVVEESRLFVQIK